MTPTEEIPMKNTLWLIAFTTLTSALTGCMVEPESTPQPAGTSESEVVADNADESVDEAQQALDSNCQSRTCVSCAPGKYRSKTVSYTKECSANGFCSCVGPSYVTYGSCLTTCDF